MKQSDLFQIIRWIDSSLEMLQAYEGRLKGPEVRVRSLLTIVRNELSRDLIENTEPDDAELREPTPPDSSANAPTPSPNPNQQPEPR